MCRKRLQSSLGFAVLHYFKFFPRQSFPSKSPFKTDFFNNKSRRLKFSMTSYPFYWVIWQRIRKLQFHKKCVLPQKVHIPFVLNKELIELETHERNRGPSRSEHFVMRSVNTKKEIKLGCTQCSFADSGK